MGWGPLLLCCWPGLPGLWYRGRWSSLLVAIVFAILLNLTLVVSFIWTGLFFDETFPAIAWPILLLIWMTTAWVAYQNLPDFMSVPVSPDTSSVVSSEEAESTDTLFIDARREYLRGHWAESESLLQRRIKHTPRDVESHLLLATLYRHTRQFNRAAEQLDWMEKYDQAIVWKNEIARERRLLDLIMEHEQSDPELDEQLPTNNDGVVKVERVTTKFN
jgi:hypothetical protein